MAIRFVGARSGRPKPRLMRRGSSGAVSIPIPQPATPAVQPPPPSTWPPGNAAIDPITRLRDRAAFDQDVEHVCKQPAAEPVALLYVDIDHFKPFNDNFGHDVGDAVLRRISEVLDSVVAHHAGRAYRGAKGDELLAIVPRFTKREVAGLAEEIRSQVERLEWNTDKGKARATVTIGCAHCPEDLVIDGKALLKAADQALLTGKGQRNRVCVAGVPTEPPSALPSEFRPGLSKMVNGFLALLDQRPGETFVGTAHSFLKVDARVWAVHRVVHEAMRILAAFIDGSAADLPLTTALFGSLASQYSTEVVKPIIAAAVKQAPPQMKSKLSRVREEYALYVRSLKDFVKTLPNEFHPVFKAVTVPDGIA